MAKAAVDKAQKRLQSDIKKLLEKNPHGMNRSAIREEIRKRKAYVDGVDDVEFTNAFAAILKDGVESVGRGAANVLKLVTQPV